MTFKLGIVSSYDVLCGNATYSQALLNGLPNGVEPVKIEVPVKLQKFRDTTIEKNILKQVTDCDGVNIQMELGLYGPTPKHSIKLLSNIIKKSKRVSLTMHRVEEQPLNYKRLVFNSFKKNGAILAVFLESIRPYVYYKHRKLVQFAAINKATFIVHTHREKERILDITSDANVLVHPIVWPDDYCTDNAVLKRVEASYGYLFEKNNLPTVGLFGFMSDYKNFLQVVRVALHENKYNILLVGGTHPEDISYGKRILTPEAKTDKEISETESISNIFMNLNGAQKSLLNYVQSPEDPELVYFIKSVDIIAVPYTEVGQSASGIASLAIQFGKRVIFSDIKTFRELFKFLNRRPYMFDTKSDLSLAKALEHVSDDDEHAICFHEHDFQSNIDTYLSSLNIALDKK